MWPQEGEQRLAALYMLRGSGGGQAQFQSQVHGILKKVQVRVAPGVQGGPTKCGPLATALFQGILRLGACAMRRWLSETIQAV